MRADAEPTARSRIREAVNEWFWQLLAGGGGSGGAAREEEAQRVGARLQRDDRAPWRLVGQTRVDRHVAQALPPAHLRP